MKRDLAEAAQQQIVKIVYLEKMVKIVDNPNNTITGLQINGCFEPILHGLGDDIKHLIKGKLKNAYRELDELENNYK